MFNPVAFADESFQEDRCRGFYLLAAAVLESPTVADVREALIDLRRALRGSAARDKLHWGHLDHKQQRFAAQQVAAIEGFHVVVAGSPVPARRQERARAACLTELVVELHGCGVTTLVLEAREAELNRRDVRTVTGARFRLPKGSAFRIEHEFGVREPLLWIADVVAGAVRAARFGDPEARVLLADRIYEVDIDTGC